MIDRATAFEVAPDAESAEDGIEGNRVERIGGALMKAEWFSRHESGVQRL